MRSYAIKTGAAYALIYWATACFYPLVALAQPTRESIAEKFYAGPPFATGGKLTTPIQEPALLNADKPLVKQGLYLARAGDCIGCHTRPGGAPFAGGLPLKTPFGVIISTNITPDASNGKTGVMGEYTQAQFNRLMREGITETGHNIYPAMPYPNYARLSDEDLAALYAYFTLGIAPVVQTNPETNLAWPFSMRWLVKAWNWLYLPKPGYVAVDGRSAEWNRGAYLVQSLGHCGACHTPRNLAGAEKAGTEKGGDKFLSGAVIDGWFAQNLRNTAGGKAGLSSWTKQDLVDYLKTGRSAHTAAFGAMAEVVGNSTQHMSLPDLSAIAVYLKSLGDGSTAGSSANEKVVTSAQTISPTALALRSGQATQPGALVYLNNCAGCHQSSGKGASLAFPSLAQSSTVASGNPTSLIRIVLQGASMPGTLGAPSQMAMPGLDWRLSDANVADVLTFIRSSWGNQANPVSAQSVAKVRAEIQK
jgi:mono/diheme cytochrome c family protein